MAGIASNPKKIPPYGFMNQDDMAVINNPTKPAGWRESQGSFDKWFEDTFRTIQKYLWPSFDEDTKTWVGESKDSMEELTKTDLTLLRRLYSAQPDAIDRPVDAPIGLQPLKTQHELFSEEDLHVTNWGISYNTYDGTFTDTQVSNLVAIITRALGKREGNVILRMKYLLRRPRAYQMATLLGFEDFKYYEALSADTPSMCHGHCAQGLLLVGAVMERFILSGANLSAESWSALEQFAVDIGDRRVLARVHYPSDLLSSWFIVMGMANHVFATPEVKEHLWSAISCRSQMFRLIELEKSVHYKKMLELIRKSAAGEGRLD
jgi:hypothetical protein